VARGKADNGKSGNGKKGNFQVRVEKEGGWICAEGEANGGGREWARSGKSLTLAGGSLILSGVKGPKGGGPSKGAQ